MQGPSLQRLKGLAKEISFYLCKNLQLNAILLMLTPYEHSGVHWAFREHYYDK